jgi:hypothetical protein
VLQLVWRKIITEYIFQGIVDVLADWSAHLTLTGSKQNRVGEPVTEALPWGIIRPNQPLSQRTDVRLSDSTGRGMASRFGSGRAGLARLVAVPPVAEAIQISHNPSARPLMPAHHCAVNQLREPRPSILQGLRHSRAACTA